MVGIRRGSKNTNIAKDYKEPWSVTLWRDMTHRRRPAKKPKLCNP